MIIALGKQHPYIMNHLPQTPKMFITLFHYSITASERIFFYSLLYFLIVKAIQKVMFHMLKLSFSLWAHKIEWKQEASTRILSFASISYSVTKTNVRALILELIIIIFYSWPNPTGVT